ncbi:MAG: MerR family transcriptional regulator [Caldilineales bacterium]
MFKISDFSKLGQVSPRMLRHYDQLGLLRPKHVDQWTGYRYYTIDQLGDLNRIVALKELGFTLEQIGELLGTDSRLSAAELQGMLVMRRAEIERTLTEERARLKRVEARLKQIELEGQPPPYEVVAKPIPAVVVASISEVVPAIDEMGFFCFQLYATLYKRLRQAGITPLQPEITLYHNEDYQETDIQVEVAVPVQPKHLAVAVAEDVTVRRLPAHDLAASLIYEGSYEDMTPAILSLLNWVGLNGHVPAGPLRELHLSGKAHPDGHQVVDSAVIEFELPIVSMEISPTP